MLLKNVSYQLPPDSSGQGSSCTLEAVHSDTRTVTVITPNQEVEVPDDEGKRFLDRYPGYLVQIKERTPAPAVVDDVVEVTPDVVQPLSEVENTPEVPKVDETKATEPNTCDICGKVCNSFVTLTMHKTSHR